MERPIVIMWVANKDVQQQGDNTQAKNIMNSNSDSPIYLIGHTKNGGTIEIHSINTRIKWDSFRIGDKSLKEIIPESFTLLFC